MNPPEHAVVCCVDEKTSIQALDRTQPILPMRPARSNAAPTTMSATASPTVRRLEVATGEVIATTRRRHRAEEFKAVPGRDRQGGAGRSRGPRRPRQLLHPQDPGHQAMAAPSPAVPPPLHAHQLVLAEPGGALVRRADPQAAPTVSPPQRPSPRSGPRAWTATWNENPRPFVWRKTADEILESLAGYCKRISDSGH